MLKLLEDNDVKIVFDLHTIQDGDVVERAHIMGNQIWVYCKEISNKEELGTTIVHEATHLMFKDEPNSLNQELKCFLAEKVHLGIPLSYDVVIQVDGETIARAVTKGQNSINRRYSPTMA